MQNSVDRSDFLGLRSHQRGLFSSASSLFYLLKGVGILSGTLIGCDQDPGLS